MNYYDRFEEEMERWRAELPNSNERMRRMIGYLEVGALVLMWLTTIWFCVAAAVCK